MGKAKQIVKNFTKYNNLLYELVKKNIKLNGKKADGSEKVTAGDEITLYLRRNR